MPDRLLTRGVRRAVYGGRGGAAIRLALRGVTQMVLHRVMQMALLG